MKNMKRIAAVTMVAGGLVAAGAGAASAAGTHGGGHGGAHAKGVAAHSPGVASGNLVQAPIHIPANVCGNTVNVIGLLNPAFGNTCVNA